MTKNSTIEMLNYFLKNDSFLKKNQCNPKEKTINTILAYAKSVKGIKTKESIRGIVSLN